MDPSTLFERVDSFRIVEEVSASPDDRMPVLIQESNLQAQDNENSFQCFYCDLRQNSVIERYKHMLAQHGTQLAEERKKREIKKQFPCKYCDKVFRYVSTRSTHHIKHHNEDHECGRGSTSSIQNVSTFGPEYLCELCPNSYWKEKSYRSHMKIHHPKVISPPLDANKNIAQNTLDYHFPCRFKDCRDTFSTSQGRNVHESKHKTAASIPKECLIYPCHIDGCTESFTSSQGRKIHASMIHKTADLVSKGRQVSATKQNAPTSAEEEISGLGERTSVDVSRKRHHKESSGTNGVKSYAKYNGIQL